MPAIKPVSDLRNHFNEISEICHKENEPVFLTKNGKGDLVVMSIAAYEQFNKRLEIYKKLTVAENQTESAKDCISHKEMIKKLKQKLHD